MPKPNLTQLDLSQTPLPVPMKEHSEAWEVLGCVMVLAFIGGAGGLWTWTFAEFLSLLVETILGPLRS